MVSSRNIKAFLVMSLSLVYLYCVKIVPIRTRNNSVFGPFLRSVRLHNYENDLFLEFELIFCSKSIIKTSDQLVKSIQS